MKRYFTLLFFGFSSFLLSAQNQVGNSLYGEGTGNFFGSSVALSTDGTRLAVGAIGNSEVAFRAGHARVFEWTAGNWVQLGEDIDGDNEWGLMGDAVSLSADGNRVAVGAPGTINGSLNGIVKVFDWDGESWIQVGADLIGPAVRDLWGTSLSLSSDGNLLAIGASHNEAGEVRILEWEGTQWVQVGQTIKGEAEWDRFGRSVSLAGNGDRVAIGAITNDDGGESAGEVKIFTWIGQSWAQLGSDLVGYSAGDNFGWVVSLSDDGNRLAVTSRYDHRQMEFGAGYVRTFEWDGSVWRSLGQDINAQNTGPLGGRGVAMSADGNRIVVGARNFSGGEYLPGYLNVYEWQATDWGLVETQLEVISEGEGIIDVVAISGDGNRFVFGTEKGGDSLGWAGKVEVFEFNPVSTEPVPFYDSIEIFPNPSSGHFRIKGIKEGQRRIFDSMGKEHFISSDLNKEINISHLPQGIYWLQFNLSGREVIKSLVKY